MPFAADWCVVRPNTRSEPHVQIDQEIFIALKGQGRLVIGDAQYVFEAGDIAAIPKHTNHYVINDSDEDFHFYVVWWDKLIAGDYMKADIAHLETENV